MPAVRKELERLQAGAEKVMPVFAQIHRRAWNADLDYTWYLDRS